MRFLDVRTDFAFNKVFGSEQSKGVLIDFLNAVIDFGATKIADLTIVDPYQIPLVKGMKDSYVDVKAILSNKKKVIIEMQVLNVEGFEKRVLYNAAKLYSTQLQKSADFATLEPIIALTITDFTMFDSVTDVISYWRLREKKTLLTYNDDIELIFIELSKFTKTAEELAGVADKWIYFIKNAGTLDFVPKTFTESALLEAFDIANTAGLSEEELEAQWKRRDFIMLQRGALDKATKDGLRQGLQMGMQQGMQQGIRQTQMATAKNMLKDGLPIEMIRKYAGLTQDEIERLQQEDQPETE